MALVVKKSVCRRVDVPREFPWWMFIVDADEPDTSLDLDVSWAVVDDDRRACEMDNYGLLAAGFPTREEAEDYIAARVRD
jgi:hypothetical protein